MSQLRGQMPGPDRARGRAGLLRALGLLSMTALLWACGGGSSSDTLIPPALDPPPSPSPSIAWTPGVFQSASSFAAYCEVPRTGIDQHTGLPYPDRPGTRVDENNWLRSWHHEYYLWYDEIIDRNPANYSTPAYFDLMQTFQLTASGQPKDRFHWSLPTEQSRQHSQFAIAAGYGVQWAILNPVPPRQIVAAYVQPGSPAALAGIVRGTRVMAVNGVSAVNAPDPASVDLLNSALFPLQSGQVYTFEILDPDATESRSVVLVSESIQIQPVQDVEVLDTDTGRVGYVHFTDYIVPAEQQLIDAFAQLAAADVEDLVLDVRYNGGGILLLGSQLAYMVAGPVATAGRTFERLRFNDKHPETDPFTGEPLTPIPFLDAALGFSAPQGTPLPTLNLPRVFMLTGVNTCSVSEALINSLRGVDVEVIQIGARTCGKPYGYYPVDNCGTTYFSIHFQTENDKGFGDFGDGFSPVPGVTAPEATLPGCQVEDDFTRALGDPEEARLAAALHYRAWGSCSGSTGGALMLSKPGEREMREPDVPKPHWLQNRIMTPQRR